MNWYDRGLYDGRNGGDVSELTDYKKQCSTHSQTVDDERYSAGRTEGLKEFCTYDNGYKWALADRIDRSNACPSESAPEFYRGYWAAKIKLQNYQPQKKMDVEVQKSADAARLRALNECKKDSDCPQKKTCASELRAMGTVTDTINVCR